MSYGEESQEQLLICVIFTAIVLFSKLITEEEHSNNRNASV